MLLSTHAQARLSPLTSPSVSALAVSSLAASSLGVSALAMTEGAGVLEFARVGARTALTRSYARSPLRLLNPRNHGPAAWVYTSTYGGGLVDGDVIDLGVHVGAGATALLSTQASTKVYRSTKPATQKMVAQVEADGLLVLIPDPIVCFAGSQFVQQQKISLKGNASLLLVDWLSAGRHASGERWAFDSYFSRIEIWRDEQKLVHESLRLGPEPELGPISERLGRFNTLAVAVASGPQVKTAVRELLERLQRTPTEQKPQLLVVASPLGEDGALLRIGGVSVEQVGYTLRECCRFINPLLGDNPWQRKW